MEPANPTLKPKRKKPEKLKSRSAAFLRKMGHTVADVERRVPGVFITFDFLGFADVLAIRPPQQGVAAYQITHSDRAADHVKKIDANDNVRNWLTCGNRIYIHLWDKRGKRGEVKTWTLYEQQVYLDQERLMFGERMRVDQKQEILNFKARALS